MSRACARWCVPNHTIPGWQTEHALRLGVSLIEGAQELTTWSNFATTLDGEFTEISHKASMRISAAPCEDTLPNRLPPRAASCRE